MHKSTTIRKSLLPARHLSILLLLVLGGHNIATAQVKKADTRIIGTVLDSETGEPIIGANVYLEGTRTGSGTDVEGRFIIGNPDPGTYTLVVSMLSYSKKRITNVNLASGQTIKLDIVLSPSSVQMDVVEVEAKAALSYEGALLTRKRKSVPISDGISAEQIKRIPGATSSDALRRVTGISVVDNKFVFIRGTSERYSTARLNGATLASTEPDKKAFAFDLFPSNLIDNMIISKTFTPDVPGDFSGGLVDIQTIDFPSELMVHFTVSPSYNTDATGKGFTTYDGGKHDALGFDDGTRSIPAGFPQNLNERNYNETDLQQYGRLLRNTWGTRSKTAPFSGSYSLSIGDGATLLGNSFGFVASLSYRNSFNVSDIERNDYELAGPKFEFNGKQSSFSVLWGGLFNFSYKISENHKLSIKNLYNRTADDDAVEMKGIDYLAAFDKKTTMLRYVSRLVYSGQLAGEHFFTGLGGLQLLWIASYSEATREEPDYRRTSYVRDQGTNDPYRILINMQPDPQNGGRFYSDLTDISKSFATDFTIPVSDYKMKFGAVIERKDRDFGARLLGFIATARTDSRLYYLDINSVFAPENIGPKGLRISEYTSGTNHYDANQDLAAGYVMTNLPFTLWNQKLRFVGGVRVEHSAQRLYSMNFAGTLPITSLLQTTEVLPSINLTYSIHEATNVRLAYSQTVNRPEFRELAPFAYYDFSTGTTIYGNPHLQRSLIQNYDLRVETFPNPGEILSASFFFKSFKNAIEQVVVPGNALGAERTFANARGGKNYGFEIELRKSLDFVSVALSDFAVTANYTRVKSNVDIAGSALGYARSDRPLQGQSPYSINVGINYAHIATGTGVSVLFNRNGERIVEVATIYDEDVVELPRDVVDVSVTQAIFGYLELKFSAKDIFGQKQVFAQGNKTARSNSKASTYSLGLSVKL